MSQSNVYTDLPTARSAAADANKKLYCHVKDTNGVAERIYIVADTAMQARDSLAQYYGMTVEVVKPSETESLAARIKSLKPEELLSIQAMMTALSPPAAPTLPKGRK